VLADLAQTTQLCCNTFTRPGSGSCGLNTSRPGKFHNWRKREAKEDY